MLFQVALKNTQSVVSTLLVSASTWSQCLSYSETTGKEIQNISLQNSLVLRNDPSSKEPFAISFKDNITKANINYLVYDTFDNSSSWANSQTGWIIQSIIKQERELVVL